MDSPPNPRGLVDPLGEEPAAFELDADRPAVPAGVVQSTTDTLGGAAASALGTVEDAPRFGRSSARGTHAEVDEGWVDGVDAGPSAPGRGGSVVARVAAPPPLAAWPNHAEWEDGVDTAVGNERKGPRGHLSTPADADVAALTRAEVDALVAGKERAFSLSEA
mmetsp:Transcript_9891/g.29170  ORF Transcript_9891/g.29170 Transcript_9891/m.29170 type:complete len:163 (+) Transcript_9891:2-490(+)